MNWLFVVKERRPPQSRPIIVDLWSANVKLARNRLRGHGLQQDLANNVMDQKRDF
jgi:hypothetical protein